jgi:meso-butanediol dehydrogenase / (S,S)-butanediol dehydrogenase / diacetyl reductase
MRLQGRGIIVTGGGSGIGQAIAQQCAAEGANVLVADIDPTGGLTTVALIEQAGGHARFVKADVSHAEDVARMVEAALAQGGRLDALVNNAARGGGDDILLTDEAEWDRVIAIVLKSVYLCTRAALPAMLEQGKGAIVNIASVNGMTGLGDDAYSAAKAGVINLTQNLAVRYGGRGIRANVVSPGTVRTPIWDHRVARQPDIFERLKGWYPLGRVGEPADVAGAVVFLLSDEAAFVNGAVLTVDGGLLAGSYRMSRELQAE